MEFQMQKSTIRKIKTNGSKKASFLREKSAWGEKWELALIRIHPLYLSHPE